MKTARDRGDQHSVFFVVWPEEKSHESQVSLPSPQHPQEHNQVSLMETAASATVCIPQQNTSTANRDSSSSYRISNSISPPLQSPESESLSSKQHANSPPAHAGTMDIPKPYSPMQPFRAVTAGHQILTLPAPAVVSLPSESQQVLVATEQQPSSLGFQTSHLLEQRDHSILLSPAHKQLLQINPPLLTGVPVVPRGQDADNLKKIGIAPAI